MSYIECPHCGHRALSVATRCPHCGHDLPPRPQHRTPPRVDLARFGPMAALVGVVVAVTALAVFVWRRSGTEPATSSPAAAPPTAPASQAPAESLAASPSDSLALTTPQPTPPATTIRRYAQTWVNIRDARRRASPSVRVLSPGEAVQVDSLQVGWYRVVVDGKPGGYVHRSNLGTAPPPRP